MSDETEQEPIAEPGTEEESEPSRIGGAVVALVLVGVAVLVMKAIIAAAPYVAYFVVGVLVCHVWHRIGAWRAKRHDPEADEAAEDEPPDVVEALQYLGRRGDSVLLTQLRKRLRVADTKAVKALLKDEGIRVREGVRTPVGNGPGVHHEDVPAPPPVGEAPSGERCSCRSGPTTPTPTTGAEEGLRVVPLGAEGKIVYDPKDTIRHHEVRSRWGHSGNGAS